MRNRGSHNRKVTEVRQPVLPAAPVFLASFPGRRGLRRSSRFPRARARCCGGSQEGTGPAEVGPAAGTARARAREAGRRSWALPPALASACRPPTSFERVSIAGRSRRAWGRHPVPWVHCCCWWTAREPLSWGWSSLESRELSCNAKLFNQLKDNTLLP